MPAHPPPLYTDEQRAAVAAAMNGWGRPKLTGPETIEAAAKGTLQEGLEPFELKRSSAYDIAQAAAQGDPPAGGAAVGEEVGRIDQEIDRLRDETIKHARRHARKPAAERQSLEGERERLAILKSLAEHRRLVAARSKGDPPADPKSPPARSPNLANLLTGETPNGNGAPVAA